MDAVRTGSIVQLPRPLLADGFRDLQRPAARNGKRRPWLRWSCLLVFLSVTACLYPMFPAAAQSSTCQFAFAGWISTQLELREARSAHRACRREARTACTAQQGRIHDLEQRLRLLRNYVDGYCRR